VTRTVDYLTVLQFVIATLLPVAAAVVLTLLNRKGMLDRLGYWQRQMLYGCVFALIAIYGTEAGIATHDATMNVRDAAPLVCGLFFGGPAGIFAGIVGGVERWFAAFWGRGMFTRLACSAATVAAGFYAAILRRYLFDGKRPHWPLAFTVGVVVEVLHLLLVIVTHLDAPIHAYLVVRACNFPMILCNALSVAFTSVAIAALNGEVPSSKSEAPDLSHTIQIVMLRIVAVGGFCMLVFTNLLLERLSISNILSSSDLLVLVISYLAIIILSVIFIAVYVFIDQVVVRSIWRVNDRLEQITAGDLTAEVDVRDSAEFALLSHDINDTVGALRNAIAAESARIEKDLVTAKAIQESALPRTFPPFPDIKSFDIYASMRAAREVGGDFYDFFMVDDHTLGFLIADVSGKGIPASLFMMEAKAELSNYMKSGMEITEAVRRANWVLCQGNDKGMFVTVWAAMLDYTTGLLTYVNAGHNYPLLRRNGSWEWIKTRCGLFLGTFETATYRKETIVLEPRDELLLYTDGVNEAFNVDGEEYGNQRLESFLETHYSMRPHMLIDSLSADLRTWSKGAEQSDDITMLCLEYGVAPETAGAFKVPATERGLSELGHRGVTIFADVKCPREVRAELNRAVVGLFREACSHYGDHDEDGEIQFAYLFDDDARCITMSLIDWGVDLADREDKDIQDTIERYMPDCVDDIAYVRDGDRNVVAFKKSW